MGSDTGYSKKFRIPSTFLWVIPVWNYKGTKNETLESVEIKRKWKIWTWKLILSITDVDGGIHAREKNIFQ